MERVSEFATLCRKCHFQINMLTLPPRCRLLIVKGFALAAGLTTASQGADSVVIFNEVQYHPAAGGGTEWIELRNLNGVNVDVSGWRLSSAVDYRFPEGIVIPGHGFLLVAANPAHPSLAGKSALGPFTDPSPTAAKHCVCGIKPTASWMK